MKTLHSIWKSEVRDYELDFQRIVNNANYFHYLDHARALHLGNIGIDVSKYSERGTNIILISTNIAFKKPLQFGDSFLVESYLSRVSKLKFLFDQKILNEKNEVLILEASSLICCIDSNSGKPCIIEELDGLEVNSSQMTSDLTTKDCSV